MSKFSSPFYPPRARWYSGFYYVWLAAKNLFHFESLSLPGRMAFGQLVLSLIVPGYAFCALRRRKIGRAILLSYGGATVVFVVWLGYALANLAMGVMIALHVISIFFLIRAWDMDWSFRSRLFLALGTLLLVGLGLYLPLRRQIERHLIMPFRVGNRVVIVNTFQRPSGIQRGDWIAYKIDRCYVGNVLIAAGHVLGRVQAVAGDQVRITPEDFKVNGRAVPRLAHMPAEAEYTVPEKHWFIWPDLSISAHGVGEDNIVQAFAQNALVPETQFVGRPFQRWFWRRQSDL